MRKCTLEKVKHEKNAKHKKCNISKVYSDRVTLRNNCKRRVHKNASTENGPSVNGPLDTLHKK